jgi:hypothetical protein
MVEMTCPLCDYTQETELSILCGKDGDLVEDTCGRCGVDFEGYLTITWEILDTRLS